MAKEKKKKGSIVINIFIILLFLVGAGIFTYPTISNYWNEYRNAQLVTKYNESVSDLSDDQYEKLWQEAEELHEAARENLRLSTEKRLRAADVQHRIDVHDLIESMDNSDKVWSQAARAARR